LSENGSNNRLSVAVQKATFLSVTDRFFFFFYLSKVVILEARNKFILNIFYETNVQQLKLITEEKLPRVLFLLINILHSHKTGIKLFSARTFNLPVENFFYIFDRISIKVRPLTNAY